MLDKAEHMIRSLSSVSFNEYYVDYIKKVQDQNINREFDLFTQNNHLYVDQMSAVIERTYKELGDILDKFK